MYTRIHVTAIYSKMTSPVITWLLTVTVQHGRRSGSCTVTKSNISKGNGTNLNTTPQQHPQWGRDRRKRRGGHGRKPQKRYSGCLSFFSFFKIFRLLWLFSLNAPTRTAAAVSSWPDAGDGGLLTVTRSPVRRSASAAMSYRLPKRRGCRPCAPKHVRRPRACSLRGNSYWHVERDFYSIVFFHFYWSDHVSVELTRLATASSC